MVPIPSIYLYRKLSAFNSNNIENFDVPLIDLFNDIIFIS